MKFIVPLFIALLLLQHSTAQGLKSPSQQKIDSLASLLKESRPDSIQVSLLNNLSDAYLAKEELTPAEFDEVFKCLRQAITLCDSLRLSFFKWKAKSLYIMGNTLVLNSKVGEGKKVFMQLIDSAQNNGNKAREAIYWLGYADALYKANKIGPFENDAETGYTKAMNLYAELKDHEAEIDMGMWIGLLHGRNAEFAKAENDFLDLIKKSKAYGGYSLPYIYCWLCTTNRYMGNYNKALEYALQSVRLIKNANDSAHAGDCYGNLAEVYEALNKPAESATWYKKCIAVRETIAGYPSFAIYRTYGLLTGQLIKAGAQKEALATIKNLQKSRPPGTLAESAVLYQSLAYCYDADNIYDSTEKYFLKTLDAYNESSKKLEMAAEIYLLSYYDIANFYVKHHQFIKSRPYLDTLNLKSGSLNILTWANVELLLFKADSAVGSYLTAIKHFQQYKSLTDSIFNDKKSKEIEELQIAYKTEKKDEQIGFLTKKDELQQANLRQANIIKNWMVASAALLVLLLGVGYNRYRLKQRTNKQLEAQQIVINQKNISLQRLVNEKEWLMKEIHHRVKNNFHIVMGLLGTQSGYLKNDEAIAAIKESQQRIHAMSLIHQKLYQSESLSSIDMPGYIHELVDYLKESFDKSDAVQFHFQVQRISLELSHIIPIGLILNEAITNVFKYAFPGKKEGNIYLSFLCTAGNIVVLTVKDDGVGLPTGFDNKCRSSMGLNLMKGLSEDIDGCFTIQSNNGTIVTVSFAYNPEIPTDIVNSVTG